MIFALFFVVSRVVPSLDKVTRKHLTIQNFLRSSVEIRSKPWRGRQLWCNHPAGCLTAFWTVKLFRCPELQIRMWDPFDLLAT